MKWVIIRFLTSNRRQAIIWTNCDILFTAQFEMIFNVIWIEIQYFSYTKMTFKMSPAKWRSFCPVLNVNVKQSRAGQCNNRLLLWHAYCFSVRWPNNNVNWRFHDTYVVIATGIHDDFITLKRSPHYDNDNENIFIAMNYITQCVQAASLIISCFMNNIHFT